MKAPCVTWSIGIALFENRVLRGAPATNKCRVTEEMRKIHNKKFHQHLSHGTGYINLGYSRFLSVSPGKCGKIQFSLRALKIHCLLIVLLFSTK
jgi:hypothetical protein